MIKQFLNYTVTSVIGMLITSLYLVVDGVFIARGVGETGVAAVTIVLPLTMAFIAISMIFSVGGGNLIANSLGAKDEKRAISIFRQSLFILTLIGIISSVAGVIFAEQITTVLGTTEALKEYAIEYLKYYLMFTVPVLLAIALSTFIRNDGSPKLSMYSMVWGAVTNIILDYIFIFPMKMGLKGAAIATGLGQLVTVVICLIHFIEKRGKLTIGKVRIHRKDINEIIILGVPSFFIEVSYSILMYFHNIAIVKYIGEVGVTAYGVVNYITNLSYMALLGIAQGIQPLMSYYYGYNQPDKSKGYYKMGLNASVFLATAFFSICLFFGKPIIAIFTNSQEVIDLSYVIFNYMNIAYIFLGVNMINITYYQSMHLPNFSNFICLLRGVVLIKIFLLVMPKILGETGIWIAMILSEALALLITIFLNKKISTHIIPSKKLKKTS